MSALKPSDILPISLSSFRTSAHGSLSAAMGIRIVSGAEIAKLRISVISPSSSSSDLAISFLHSGFWQVHRCVPSLILASYRRCISQPQSGHFTGTPSWKMSVLRSQCFCVFRSALVRCIYHILPHTARLAVGRAGSRSGTEPIGCAVNDLSPECPPAFGTAQFAGQQPTIFLPANDFSCLRQLLCGAVDFSADNGRVAVLHIILRHLPSVSHLAER